MMNKLSLYRLLTYMIAAVWFINGLLCKLLNWVPRHEEIVARILGDHATILTNLIGISEIFMAVWIVSGFKSRWNAILQIVIILTMNVLEFILTPDLLLWGKFNIIFALIFSVIIYLNEFHLKPNPTA